MNRNLCAVFLLATFSLGLFAGPHPCKASKEARESKHSSCHEAAGFSNGPEVRADAPSHGDRHDRCDTFCQHVCHMTAVAEAGLVVFAIRPVSHVVVETTGLGLRLFSPPIDHVPLA